MEKCSGHAWDWIHQKRLEAKVQKSTGRAHRGYTEDVVSKTLQHNLSSLCILSIVSVKKRRAFKHS